MKSSRLSQMNSWRTRFDCRSVNTAILTVYTVPVAYNMVDGHLPERISAYLCIAISLPVFESSAE